VALQVFENTEFTSIRANLPAVNNATGNVFFLSLDLDLIFQRKLIAYSAISSFVSPAGLGSLSMNHMVLTLFIEQPLNTTQQFIFGSSAPAGGVFTPFTNTIALPGNTTTVSILPVPLKVVRLGIFLSDPASVPNAIFANITLFWETKKAEKLKFVGD